MKKKVLFILLTMLASLGLVTVALAAANRSPGKTPQVSAQSNEMNLLSVAEASSQSNLTTQQKSYTWPGNSAWRSPQSPNTPGDWDGYGIYAPTVISDSGVLKMWYSGSDFNNTGRIGYAESDDGILWTRSASNPVLDVGAPGEWDSFGIGQPSIIKQGGLYQMWYFGVDDFDIKQIGYATSTNGVDWNKYAGNPVLTVGAPGAWDETEVGGPRVLFDGATYHLWYHGYNGSCCDSIGYATSPDGVNWTKYAGNPVFGPGEPGQWDEAYVFFTSVLTDTGLLRMWYSVGSPSDGIGYVTSTNGITWTRFLPGPVLPRGNAGEWDENYIFAPTVIQDGGLYRMWYTGYNLNWYGSFGYATSSDGIVWTKSASNPVFRRGSPGLVIQTNYAHEWIWAVGAPDVPITITIPGKATVVGMTDGGGEFRSWEWGWDPQQPDIAPGDIVTATAAGVTTEINPIGVIEGEVEADDDTVSGVIHAPWLDPITLTVRCEIWVENGPPPIEVTGVPADGGSYFCDFGADGWDIQPGQQAAVIYREPDGDEVINVFEPPWMRVNYGHDWVGGNFPAGHDFWITITNDVGDFKAVAAVTSQPNNGWGGDGFQTEWYHWTPETPDIQPGDWALFRSDTGYANDVQVGEITGAVDSASDSVSGSIYADWFSGTLNIECHPWGGPPGAPGKNSTAGIDGDPPYLCQWDPMTEWDVQPGQDIAVMYIEPDADRIINVFAEPDYNLYLRVNYGHDWIESFYEAGHSVWITVTDGAGVVKATANGETGPIPWWGGDPGYQTGYNVFWDGPAPDIQTGDWVYGALDNGYTAAVQIGEVSGYLNLNTDSITGTINAPWFTQTLNGDCGVWVDGGPGMGFSVDPNNGPYACDFSGQWDLVAGQDVGVAYTGEDGHWVANAFREPAPHLWINTWTDGDPGEGGNYTLRVRYNNDGEAPGENVLITSTLLGGMTYLGDTSGLPHTGSGAPGDPLVWDVGDLPVNWQGDERFDIFVQITAAAGETITHVVQIENGTPYWQNDQWQKESAWNGQVQPNDTQLNVYKGTWTGDPAPGYDYVYNINICNNGGTGSTELTLSDTLPPSTTLVTWWGQNLGWEDVSIDPQTLILTRPSISGWWCSEVYVQVNLDAAAWPGMPITNTAAITASNDLDPNDNESTIVLWAGSPHTNLSIYKDWESGQLVPSGQMYYDISYRNNSNIPVDDVLITSTLPVSATFAGSWYGDESGQHPVTPTLVSPQGYVVWNLGTLIGGYHGRFTISWMIDPNTPPGTVLKHTVDISTLPVEDDFDDNQVIWFDTVNSSGPNLRLDTQNYNWWNDDRLSFEVRVLNMGDERIEDLVITDTIPLSTTFNGDWHIGHGPWISYTYDAPSGQIVFYLDGLNPGETASSDFRVNLDPAVVGVEGLTFTNIVEGTVPDEVYPPDNTDEVTAFTGPDLYVEKALAAGDLLPGELITFTLSFGNGQHGSAGWWSAESSEWLTDTLPEGLTFVSADMLYCGDVNWCDFDPLVNEDGVVVWELWPLWTGSHNTIRVTARIADDVTGLDVLVNTVEIVAQNPENDIEVNYANNTDSLALPIALPYFEIGKIYEGNGVAGTIVTYTLTVTNAGNGQGDNILVTDQVPDWFTYGGGGDDYSAELVSWNLPKIGPGYSTETVWFSGTLSCSAGGVVNNQFYQVAASDQGITSTNGAPVGFTIQAPAINVVAESSAATILPGGTVYFTATAATDGTPLTYSWAISGTVIGSDPTASYTFDAPGVYEVVVTVTDGCGFTDTYTVTVVVETYEIYLPIVKK